MLLLNEESCVGGDVWRSGFCVVCFELGFELFVERAKVFVYVLGYVVLMFVWSVV